MRKGGEGGEGREGREGGELMCNIVVARQPPIVMILGLLSGSGNTD